MPIFLTSGFGRPHSTAIVKTSDNPLRITAMNIQPFTPSYSGSGAASSNTASANKPSGNNDTFTNRKVNDDPDSKGRGSDGLSSEQLSTSTVNGVRQGEFVPADVSDAEYQAQQRAEQRQQQQGASRESQQFLQTQDLTGDNRRGQFIDIQV